MWMMFRVIPILWRAVRPSRVDDMPAVVNTFWLRKGYEGLTFFGTILTPTQREADEFNSGFGALKNHEMIHLRQAQACGDSWLRFYLLYIWYWLKDLAGIWFFLRWPAHLASRPRNIAYLLNPFEMEAYREMYDLDYLERCEGGAQQWRQYAKMSLEERLSVYQNNHKQI